MEFFLEVFQRQEVGRNILADRGVRAAACLHCANAFRFQRLMADEKLAIFPGENIVGHGGEAKARAQTPAQRQHQRGFAAAHRTTHTNRERALMKIAGKRQVTLMELAGMVMVFTSVAVASVLMGMCAHKFSGSALKQARVEPVLARLPDFKQGRGLRDVGDGQMLAFGKDGLGARCQPMLHGLRFHWPGDAKPDRPSRQTAQMLKKEQTPRACAAHTQHSQDGAEHRREMAQGKMAGLAADIAGAEDFRGRRKQRTALQAAGAIGHMIAQQRIAKTIQFRLTFRFIVRRCDERKASMSKLRQAGFDERLQLAGIANFPVLPG